jgi:hypothetical protein
VNTVAFKRKMMWRGTILAAIIVAIAWLLNHIGLGGGGGLAESNSLLPDFATRADAPEESQPAALSPLEIVIRGDAYLADGKPITLEQAIARARQRGRSPEAVKIISGADARLGTQRDLQSALDAAGLKWGVETQP